ncbi:MAG: hypothetical protein K0S70_1558 [Microbacterium sp.]|uniref:hypothetical protein n=1 Tax=Microbacterium TaxID=33882 RepID=UPI0023DC5E8C|nr:MULTISPECIES: hypothetical protein [Microbacterium]MDF2046373.1 hypothetical protein [Microbacterium sp. Kw_RZR3]MDF2917341.1 hypothetical protein [Microbacterium sp.]MDQ1075854.1 hypothetical protein [Microbacterium sp. SORGH_AS_0969]MDQ1116099.1 hypothetical protein [Microbacterium testaceum]
MELDRHGDIALALCSVPVDFDDVIGGLVNVTGEGFPLASNDTRDGIVTSEGRLVTEHPRCVRCPHAQKSIKITFISAMTVHGDKPAYGQFGFEELETLLNVAQHFPLDELRTRAERRSV